MGDIINRREPSSSLLAAGLARLSAKLAPLVRAELLEALVAELERHFNEYLVSEVDRRVETIVDRELRKRVDAIVADELPARVEAMVARELPARVEAIADRVLIEKQSQMFEDEAYRRRFRPNDILAGSISGEYMAASNALARDFFHPAYQEFCRIYKVPLQLHRKLWEWAFIYDRLSKAGVLRPGMRGLGFGVGTEKLPSFFASLGACITATDAPIGKNWDHSSDVSDHRNRLFDPEMIDRNFFDDRVSFEYCDMNNIPSHLIGYDFCWSSCSFEHLGSLQHGIDFVVNSIERSLRIGGVACHTTELNLSSNDETIEAGVTVLYRKKDIELLCRTLQERGHRAEPLRIEPGTMPPDYFVDVPPYPSNPHLKVLVGSYVTTSVGIVAKRAR